MILDKIKKVYSHQPRALPSSSGEHEHEENLSEEKLEIEFVDETDVLAMAAAVSQQKQRERIGQLALVRGFNFPIADEDTVELLEATVNVDKQVREDYINYLKANKPPSAGIVSIFHHLFRDEAMYSYNYSGICHRGPGRKAMQNYTIFGDCMLDAWKDHGISRTMLKESLCQAIKNINGRKRNRKYFAKRRIKDRGDKFDKFDG
ncbi:uncharacterized protein LOC131430422 isoform X2 [Malaya genurostris]|uniref:uncharacterized protein LOC131430422 isoform X2 n=1 Tax=Malaya genurostris TaxID=325434 RepID=UPI0026F403A2|nr:uncharacterized protein LOC131430422 isoform X2 [Malaya genurostris]